MAIQISKTTEPAAGLPADINPAPETAEQDPQQEALEAQIDLNKIEAASSRIFIAGWRPFIGWVCGMGLALYYVLLPLAKTIFPDLQVAKIDTLTLIPLVFSLLGLGSLRSFEKVKGVHHKH